MQALRERLEEITKILGNLGRTDLDALSDAKSQKSLAFVIDKVLEVLDTETCALQQLKLRTLKKMDARVATVRPALEAAEARFMAKYTRPPPVPRPLGQMPAFVMKTIPVNMAGLTYACPLYREKNEIPVMSYGAVMLRSAPMVVFRYSQHDYVSVTACHVTDNSSMYDNVHTVCCGNGPTCEYGANCRYFHDPVEWPESTHVQKFQRTTMVKRCPQFGNAADFVEHASQLTFDQLRTLARYCAVQALLVHLVATRR